MSEIPAAVAEFPTADTVPFPYKSPYNVQRELMAAILDSLRQCQDQDAHELPTNDEDGGIDDAGGIAKPKIRRAPIIMLESPTGTGKSLSLACASMAWLKYCQQNDMDKLLSSNVSNDTIATVNATNDASAVSSVAFGKEKKIKKYDWIEAWQPADQNMSNGSGHTITNSDRNSSNTPMIPHSECSSSGNGNSYLLSRRSCQREDRVRSFAIENRAALESELTKIRTRLDRLHCVATSDATTLAERDRDRRDKERTLRENLVRSGVASALAIEKKSHRRLALYSSEKSVGRGKKRRNNNTSCEDDPFLLETYNSDDEAHHSNKSIHSDDEEDDVNGDEVALSGLRKNHVVGNRILSSRALLEGSNIDGSGYLYDAEKNARFNKSLEMNTTSDDLAVGGVKAGSGFRKIVYAARTHSQLSQFIGELKRTHWGNEVKVVALGSRSLLCSNDHVLYSSLINGVKVRRSEAEITEMCLDMQTKKSASRSTAKTDDEMNAKQKSSCPYMVSSEAISTLALHSLVRPSDIEDMAKLGKASHTCSYYASRKALAAAEVVVVPYNILLSRQARQATGLSIKNALVIIDEAHNIPETLRNISSCQLSLAVAEMALAQLLAYTKKYSGRLAGRNVFYLGQIRRILSAMIKYLKCPPIARAVQEDTVPQKQMMAAVDLMFTLKLDNINLFTILRYLEKSRLSQKLLGFINHTAADSTAKADTSSEFWSKYVSSMSIFETFLERLTVSSKEGKVIVEWPVDSPMTTRTAPASYRFTQIHSSSQFDDVLHEAHAIVLAGGTLRPFTHVAAELFGNDLDVLRASLIAETQLSRDYDLWSDPVSASPTPSSLVQRTPRLTTFTCGHVIPPSNVHLSCLSSGPTRHKLDFRHSTRSSIEIIDELGRTILNLCNIVPHGFVVFLPSYNYESSIFSRWRATGTLNQIEIKKSIHREPKNSRDLEAALARYSDETCSKRGAVLFSVMGGKMSEGINFADQRARCVLVVGLPYPDITDPILREKMQSLDNESANSERGITGQAYYQNLCMRTVNQSVGRAIRHADDYAAIVLADFRYATDERIWRGLPRWLREGCDVSNHGSELFNDVECSIKAFFANKL